MSGSIPSDDDSDGDLGLGDGLKPGALPNLPDPLSEYCFQSSNENAAGSASTSARQNGQCEYTQLSRVSDVDSEDETDSDSDSDFELSLMPIKPIQELKANYSSKEPSKRSTETFPQDPSEQKAFGNCLLDCDLKEHKSKTFPVFADVPYGTSIRQQKELFNQNIEDLRIKHGTLSITDQSGSRSSIFSNSESRHGQQLTSEEIAMELAKRLQEVEDLKNELETCESRLDSKYKAIDILRKQAEDAQTQLRTSEKMSKETTVKLAQVCYTGDGGGGVSYSEIVDQDLGSMAPSNIIHRHKQPDTPKEVSRKVPREKYNRVCKENASLLSALEAKTEELRKLTAQKMAVERENDELLALLDIQERAKYEKSRSVSSEDEYCTFNSTELAILGACRCRIISPNPCGCAHAAASLKKEVLHFKEEILQYKNRRDEAFLTVDAYRKAFEEQLERSKALTLQLGNLMTSANTRTSKAKQALKWLIGTLNDDEIDYENDKQTSNGPMMSEHEFITYLIEMLNEKKEVLAHQKLMSQILNNRLKTAEEKLLKYEAKDVVFT